MLKSQTPKSQCQLHLIIPLLPPHPSHHTHNLNSVFKLCIYFFGLCMPSTSILLILLRHTASLSIKLLLVVPFGNKREHNMAIIRLYIRKYLLQNLFFLHGSLLGRIGTCPYLHVAQEKFITGFPNLKLIYKGLVCIVLFSGLVSRIKKCVACLKLEILLQFIL